MQGKTLDYFIASLGKRGAGVYPKLGRLEVLGGGAAGFRLGFTPPALRREGADGILGQPAVLEPPEPPERGR